MSIKIELEFIPVSERLPEESGDYVCLHNLDRHNSVRIVSYCYSAKHKAFNVKDSYGSYDAKNCSLNYVISAWAALPDLSKASEPSAFDTGQAIQEMKELELGFWREEKKRRRDLFIQVALASPQFGHPSWSQKLTSELAEEILKAADKFARGEL